MSNTTKAIGHGTANLSVNITLKLKEQLEALASESDMKLGAYCRKILEAAAKDRVKFKVVVDTDGK